MRPELLKSLLRSPDFRVRAYATRVLGDTRTSTLSEIWRGPVASKVREEINGGGSSFCGDCPLKLPLAPDEGGLVHTGPEGSGHFVKMVHNGIEYGLMAAYAEGLNILKHANAGKVARDERSLRRDDPVVLGDDMARTAQDERVEPVGVPVVESTTTRSRTTWPQVVVAGVAVTVARAGAGATTCESASSILGWL